MLHEKLVGKSNLLDFSEAISELLISIINGLSCAIYLFDRNKNGLALIGGYALPREINTFYKKGEGLIGQHFIDQKSIQISSNENFKLNSALLSTTNFYTLIIPISNQYEIKGVIEISKLSEFSLEERSLIKQLLSIGCNYIDNINYSQEMKLMIDQLSQKTNELLTQEEELRQNNLELEKQTQMLIQSEE